MGAVAEDMAGNLQPGERRGHRADIPARRFVTRLAIVPTGGKLDRARGVGRAALLSREVR